MIWLALALAHDVRPGAVALTEVEPDAFSVRLNPPEDGGLPVRMAPDWPEGCVQTDLLRCPLEGPIRLPGLQGRPTVVSVSWEDGHHRQVLTTTDQVVVRDRELSTEDRSGYVRIGAEHVLAGPDHLFFVLALPLVAGRRWRLAGAVTAFTVGHSLSLAAAVLGGLTAPGAAVELLIAASVLLMAREAAVEHKGWTARAPAVVAGLFGLVHGLGFAGAVADIGLPEAAEGWALLKFNVGVELGQLAVLAIALLVLTRVPERWLRWLAYGLGVPAAVWTLERALAWMG